MAEKDAADILRRMLDRAKGGDHEAAVFVLNRLWPARRGRPVTSLPALPDDAAGALDVVLGAIQAGTLTPEEGATLAGVVHRRAELRELRAVLDELEKQSR
jgi:hypothetical protein